MGNFQVSGQNVQVTVETRVTATRPEPQPLPAPIPESNPLDQADALELSRTSTPIEIAKKLGGGALLGGGITAVVQSAVTSMVMDRGMAPTVPGTALGVALGAGIGLINIETGDKNLNAVKNTVGGALMGGSILGMAASVVGTMATDRLMSVSPIAMGVGAAIGAGIGLLNSQE
ncbi:hypothetical protein COW36_15230 [bacterium (Candidatus Blackallbacteria) CG17_big_fil_post_rev_8_21_14_2_50_48_46]|uniref:Uncharacterized protein n=1 Tax=bacterium (Candidatus Blackallbacteria) CG17_big_fil_post_rev_8_21_14_2_50_48_46 TaxID=2014261 RepID=A0A2M7G2P9_9BACT|nr:MAG: hypothetical protein COW64_11320 [bacterium (Candidatus Blackallbacteria) CG18_big_fil_WC_8_21_14_2_50_49_26]PIW16063.1 MAG: hypothetical protein COW36_15230 [bacterium (Candidatus Blackallbacteria) CG17_big_fil_post_rev_8_21_14_2_50_48_46]PIW50475.1 MAG: hypothetical protein COW20_02945 [bacterium (Candidatus Blackallbacteria) CG13_big_fil_rev_8_21_14_2_50_49_14]